MEDSEIVVLFFDRNEMAIEQTQKKYGKKAHDLSLHITHSREDAEECVNDAYLRLWNTIPPKRPDSLCAFFLRIVRNLSLDRYRRAHSQKRFGAEVAFEELEACLPDEEGTIGLQTENGELRESLDRFLEGLDERERLLFMRRYWFMDSHETLARMFSISEGAVRQRLFRTREKLREFLKKEGIGIS